mmetsp:Transcript_5743/g.21764  ORF Transcript_5743/g.21764 Transcript_5743/m.21764 type:complete len:97 (-) Transcript_5743:287-577(-)
MQKDEVILQVIQKFITFVKDKFQGNEKLIEECDKLNNYSAQEMKQYVKTYLRPFKGQMDVFATYTMQYYGIEKKDIGADDWEKYKKYFDVFIKVCE